MTERRRPEGRKWLKMGVELEGSWVKNHRDLVVNYDGAVGKSDASVKNLPGYIGEITTKPHTSLEALIKDIEGMHPDYTNETAGLHIHASFHPLDYMLLTTKEFWRFFRERWEAWGDRWQTEMTTEERRNFWDRFHNRSTASKTYCKNSFEPEDQMINHTERYTQLNFRAYEKYKTLECRLLPMFSTKKITIEAIKELSDIYDIFLNTFQMPPVLLKKEMKETGGEVIDQEKFATPEIAFFEEAYGLKSPALETGEDILYHIPGAEKEMKPFGEDGEYSA